MSERALTVIDHDTGTAIQHAPTPDYALMMRVGAELSKSRFLPEAVKTPEQAFAIIVAGQELGLPPMQALRSIVLVKGKVTLSSELMLALTSRAGVRHEWTETTDERVTLKLTRPGYAAHVETYSMDDVKKAGNAGGMYSKYPRNMLRARCVSNACRAYCPDILMGVYVEGELDDPIPTDEPRRPEPAAPAKKHHESWARDRARFCARLGELFHELAKPYEAVADFCESKGMARPSALSQSARDKLLARLETPEGADAFFAWVKDQPLDAIPYRSNGARNHTEAAGDVDRADATDDESPL